MGYLVGVGSSQLSLPPAPAAAYASSFGAGEGLDHAVAPSSWDLSTSDWTKVF